MRSLRNSLPGFGTSSVKARLSRVDQAGRLSSCSELLPSFYILFCVLSSAERTPGAILPDFDRRCSAEGLMSAVSTDQKPNHFQPSAVGHRPRASLSKAWESLRLMWTNRTARRMRPSFSTSGMTSLSSSYRSVQRSLAQLDVGLFMGN